MKTECVTKVWEFYRDNCAGYKEPMRKEMRKLDDYVADLLADNANLRNDADLLRSMLQAKRKDTHALMSENAELREQLAKARDPQRIGGTADPESFVYAIEQLREFRWQHATNDEEAIPYINNVADAHERENAKLRESVKRLMTQRDDRLARAEAENAKLREDMDDQEGYDQMLRDRLRQQTELHVKSESENSKLRSWCGPPTTAPMLGLTAWNVE